MRKLIGFDDDTLDKLTMLGRNRMATLQDLADEAFADLLKKHGVPIDLHDALKKSVRREEAGKRTGKDLDNKAGNEAIKDTSKPSPKRTGAVVRKLSRA